MNKKEKVGKKKIQYIKRRLVNVFEIYPFGYQGIVGEAW